MLPERAMRTATVRLILLFSILTFFAHTGQSQSVYSFQQDDTVLRKKYNDQSLKKKELLLASVGKEYASDYKEIYENQFKEIGNLWQSSRPVTSPEAYAYLQSLVQKIIAANPELKGTDARVIFSRDWWPNAFSMGDGTIAINAGLVIFLDNEAELVFIVCHELAHYYLGHTQKSIKKYVETVNSAEFKAEVKRLSKEEYRVNQQLEKLAKSITFDSRHHSRENEAEADRQAFKFMKNTGYDCGAAKTTLSLLDKIDDSLVLGSPDIRQTFNFPDYPFKRKWVEKESSIFSQVTNNSSLSEKERDSLKTHPDCSKRILLLNDSLRTAVPGQKFMVNENLFKRLKKDFFYEMTEHCYRSKNLSRNLYYSLKMLDAKENMQLAVFSIARSLNMIYENQKTHTMGDLVSAETRGYPDDYNLLLRMLSRLRLEEVANVSYYFCNQYASVMKDYPGFEAEMNKARRFKQQ
jgi:Zn-dependent protease with chaperone function